MAKVDAMSLMASSAKSIMNAAGKSNIRKVEGNTDSFGQYFAKQKEPAPAEQASGKKDGTARDSVITGNQKANPLKKREYVSDMGNDNMTGMTAGTMTVEQAVQVVTEIRQIVKDGMGTDDNALDQTLRAMGITALDLLDPDTLKAFVLELTGADPMELLTNELLLQNFQGVMELLNDYAEENQSDILALMELLDTKTPLEELVKPEDFKELMGKLTGDPNVALTVTSEAEPSAEKLTVTEQAGGTVDQEAPAAVAADGKEAITEEQSGSEEGMIERFSIDPAKEKQENMGQSGDPGKNDLGADTGKGKTDFTEMNQGVRTGQTEETEGLKDMTGAADVLSKGEETETLKESEATQNDQTPFFQIHENHHIMQGNIREVAEVNFQSAGRMLQAIDITRQVSEQMRSSLSEGVTRLEMQLNPESLGKVLLMISAKEGMMTATFRVQTEDARQALESQMFTLRENLEAKNIKVEAVDVQISNFDFTENGEAEQRMKEEMEKKTKKAFDFSVAEEEPEEAENSAEEVRRSVMRDRGGSIDFTA